jgi:hypothetical protein
MILISVTNSSEGFCSLKIPTLQRACDRVGGACDRRPSMDELEKVEREKQAAVEALGRARDELRISREANKGNVPSSTTLCGWFCRLWLIRASCFNDPPSARDPVDGCSGRLGEPFPGRHRGPSDKSSLSTQCALGSLKYSR